MKDKRIIIMFLVLIWGCNVIKQMFVKLRHTPVGCSKLKFMIVVFRKEQKSMTEIFLPRAMPADLTIYRLEL